MNSKPTKMHKLKTVRITILHLKSGVSCMRAVINKESWVLQVIQNLIIQKHWITTIEAKSRKTYKVNN